MDKKQKYEKCLNFINNLYRLKFDTLVSLHESIYNEYISEKAEKFLKEIGEFKEDNR